MNTHHTFIALLLLGFSGGMLAAPEKITSVGAIRALDRGIAGQGLPLEIRGIVTYSYEEDVSGNFVIEQDGTGIFVNVYRIRFVDADGRLLAGADIPRVSYGMELIVRGKSASGQYAPTINAEEIQVLGHKPLPPARPFVLGDVLTGSMDCQRLEVHCVVQGAEIISEPPPHLRLEVAVPAGRMIADCKPPGFWTPEKLIGATIRMSAVCLTYFNVRGEMLGVHFVMNDPSDLLVEKPAPTDPFAVPMIPLTSLQPFSVSGPNLERVQIAGQVTCSRSGEFFYLDDGQRSVRVVSRDEARYIPGEWVVASGFIDLHQSFAELREARVRRTGPGKLQEPPLISQEMLIDGSSRFWRDRLQVDFNGRLIRVQGILAKSEKLEDGSRRLLFTTDGGSVAATLDADGGAAGLDELLPGTQMDVTGICEMQFPSTQLLTDFPRPTGFSLLLRSPEDLKVIQAASWWTPARMWIMLGSMAGLLGLALTWNLLLRRIVKKRSSQLAAEMRARDRVEIEFDATLRERTRLAADLHDTLEQALTGLAFQLDTSKVLANRAPETSGRHLELGRQLLTRSREDLRRSIWNLRARALDDHNFADAIRAAAQQAAEGRPINISVEELGEPRPLPEFIAGNLLLLAQEGMTNAIKHGQAEIIAVRVVYEPGWISLEVQDDGVGFHPKSAPGLQEGHFGLQGMRERANRLDGSLHIESRPGKGATISVRVPVPDKAGTEMAAATAANGRLV